MATTTSEPPATSQNGETTPVSPAAPVTPAASSIPAASSPPTAPAKLAITVLADRVLVSVGQAEGERRSRSGILIPATAQVSRRLVWAETVAVGPHVRSVKVGDTVLFNPEDRFEVEVQGDEYVILRERDIHAVAATRIDGDTGLYL